MAPSFTLAAWVASRAPRFTELTVVGRPMVQHSAPAAILLRPRCLDARLLAGSGPFATTSASSSLGGARFPSLLEPAFVGRDPRVFVRVCTIGWRRARRDPALKYCRVRPPADPQAVRADGRVQAAQEIFHLRCRPTFRGQIPCSMPLDIQGSDIPPPA
jgi:hypothetical protein